jgi:hypothetical protein
MVMDFNGDYCVNEKKKTWLTTWLVWHFVCYSRVASQYCIHPEFKKQKVLGYIQSRNAITETSRGQEELYLPCVQMQSGFQIDIWD